MNKKNTFRTVSNEKEYEAIMARIDELVEIVEEDTPKTTKESVELDFLADLVVAYENSHYRIEKPSYQNL